MVSTRLRIYLGMSSLKLAASKVLQRLGQLLSVRYAVALYAGSAAALILREHCFRITLTLMTTACTGASFTTEICGSKRQQDRRLRIPFWRTQQHTSTTIRCHSAYAALLVALPMCLPTALLIWPARARTTPMTTTQRQQHLHGAALHH
jgi:hypothetical protein